MLRSERLEEIRKERMNTVKLWVFEAAINAALWIFLFWIALR